MTPDAAPERIHDTWLHSSRPVPRRFVRPLLRFMHVEAAGGIVLVVAALAALVWANAPFGETYERFWASHLTIELGPLHFHESLKHVVNDGLMAVFFLVVGLEIKRELVDGDLRDPKRAALPAIAALGGMVVPALIFVAFAIAGGEGASGWGIPMATDIAFSIGVLSLLGTRVPVGAKLFLLALAIADDIGAIVVIAVFYTSDLAAGWLLGALAVLALIHVASRVGIRSIVVYGAAAVVVWFMVLESGVHATLAGVALAFLTPAAAWYSDSEFVARSQLAARGDTAPATRRGRERLDEAALQLAAVARESVAPLTRLERALHPWTSFLVIPAFALANAGVRVVGVDMGAALTQPVTVGVALGLVIGKLVGISGATWLAVRAGVGKLPANTDWSQIVGVAALAGIGFTVSLFIAELAFTDAALIDAAKLGIFIGSGFAGMVGALVLARGKAPAASPGEFDSNGERVPAIAPARA
jgi:NhaA family Na+:H+ antiporter